jgi:sortase A
MIAQPGTSALDTPQRRPLKWLERLLLVGGVAALTWCAYVVASAHLVQRLARERFEASSPPAANASRAPADAPSTVVAGTPLAELSIPRLGLWAMVLQGSDDETLRLGVGHIEATPLPGATGNVAIAGHRDSFFRPLQHVQIGDDVWLDNIEHHVHYRVSWFRVVSPYEVSVIGPATDPLLTLVTCYPFRFIGPAPDRFVVRAVRIEDPDAGREPLATR